MKSTKVIPLLIELLFLCIFLYFPAHLFFSVQTFNVLATYGLIWLVSLFVLNIKSREAYFLSIIFLLVCIYMDVVKDGLKTDKFAFLSYWFVLLGAVKQLPELIFHGAQRSSMDILVEVKEKVILQRNYFRGVASKRTKLKRLNKFLGINLNQKTFSFLVKILLYVFNYCAGLFLILFFLVIIVRLIPLVSYFHFFFEENFLNEIFSRLLIKICLSSLLLFVFCFLSSKIKHKIGIFLFVVTLSVFGGYINFILQSERSKLDNPYILRLTQNVVSGSNGYKISGRNFGSGTIKGKVFVDEREQIVESWDENTIIVKIDSQEKVSGFLYVEVNCPYGEVSSNRVKILESEN